MLNDKGRVGALIAGGLLIAGVASAEPRIQLAPTSRLELLGKSTLHDFESRATKMDLAVELAPALPAGSSPLVRLAAPGAVKSFVFTVPVQALHSSRDGLDKNLYKALKASAHPNIAFHLTALPQVAQIEGGGVDVIAQGELEVAGQRRPIDLAVHAIATPEGLVLEGREALLMSDYGIKAPTMMLGAIKTQDRVEVSFHLLLTAEGF